MGVFYLRSFRGRSILLEPRNFYPGKPPLVNLTNPRGISDSAYYQLEQEFLLCPVCREVIDENIVPINSSSDIHVRSQQDILSSWTKPQELEQFDFNWKKYELNLRLDNNGSHMRNINNCCVGGMMSKQHSDLYMIDRKKKVELSILRQKERRIL
uniref:RING-type domain-containing protein n=1 Tax=Heterorhabditis bacteriophora TaxID=37862 RepID=A0A1I7XQJ8_HETBA